MPATGKAAVQNRPQVSYILSQERPASERPSVGRLGSVVHKEGPMGDRVSVSFVNGDDESVALFSHWGGMDFVKQARAYAQELVEQRTGGSTRARSIPVSALSAGKPSRRARRSSTGAGRTRSSIWTVTPASRS